MKIWKKSIMALTMAATLGGSFLFSGAADAVICSNNVPPQGVVHWNQLQPNGSRWVQYAAWDNDNLNVRRLLVYRSGSSTPMLNSASGAIS